MRELIAIIEHGLIYLFQSVLASATIIGVLYLVNALVELIAPIIPDWLALTMPCLLILAVMFGICGGRVHERNNCPNKKCPCCGGKAKLESSAYSGTVYIHCLKCGLSTKMFMFVREAVDIWNRRVHVE